MRYAQGMNEIQLFVSIRKFYLEGRKIPVHVAEIRNKIATERGKISGQPVYFNFNFHLYTCVGVFFF